MPRWFSPLLPVRQPGPVRVLCHGVFDYLHYGHLLLFQKARDLAGEGEVIVTITADRFVNKGAGRPFFKQNERMAMLRALAIVDTVDICNGSSGVLMIRRYKPDVYLKHEEYEKRDPHGYLADEKRMVESYGGELQFWRGKKWSSTELISRLAALKEAA